MLHYDFGLICESAIIDQQTNYLSVIKVIEGFNFKSFPSSLPKLYLVTSWSKTSDYNREQKSTVRITVTGSDDEDASPKTEFEVVIPSDKKKLRAIIEIGGLPVKREGEHRVVVEVKEGSIWTEVGYISFDVTNSPLPEDVIGLPKD